MDVYRTEEEQVAAIQKWWQQNGKAVLVAVVLAVASYAGWVWYKRTQLEASYAASGLYQTMMQSYQELAAGGVDIVTCSIPEARAMIDANRARALAIMAPARNPMFAQVPTLNETLGINYSVGAWRGIAGPRNMPAEIANTLGAALKRAFDNREFQDFMASRGFGTVWGDAAQFATFMAQSDVAMGEAMRGAGLARS